MLIIYADKPEIGRSYHPIGRIKAVGPWRGADITESGDRAKTIQALKEEAEGYDADAILGVRLEIDNLRSGDVDGTPLKRLSATGVAVKFDEAA
jgi:hypothetical protein